MDENVADVLVVGAGLAGLSCAADLHASGARVVLLDKGRGAGGRAATRRLTAPDGANVRVDHGAQFFTARSERFQAFVDGALADGWLRVWSHGFPLWENGEIVDRPEGHARYAPPDGMSQLPRHLAQGLDVQAPVTVAALRRDSDCYVATDTDGNRWRGRQLVLNLPPVQLLALAKELLAPVDIDRIMPSRLSPAWTWIALLERDIEVEWPALELSGHPVLSWIARDHTRRADPTAPPALVAHAHGVWSDAHLEMSPDEIAPLLQSAVENVVGPLSVTLMQAHRWRYAQPAVSLGNSCMWDYERQVGVCGDWCDGGRVEGAILSGWALAEAMQNAERNTAIVSN